MRSNAGGPPRSVSRLIDNLVPLGVKVCLVTTDLGNASGEWILPCSKKVDVRVVPSRYWEHGRILYAPAFRRTLFAMCRAAGAPLVLHDHDIWLHTGHDSAMVARSLGVPRIVSTRGALTRWAFSHKAWKKRLAWALYQRQDLILANVIHATSADEADDLRLLDLQTPIIILPNGVPSQPRVPTVKTYPRTALFLSRISPKKGLLDLVAAWDKIRPLGWRCLIVGPDEENHRLAVEQAITQRGLSDVIVLYGAVSDSDKWKLFSSAQLFILPTHSENFGLVVAESLSCGVPVITTKAAPWHELTTERCGWWIDVGVEPLVQAMQNAMSMSEQERAEMGERGQRLVAERYTWHSIARRMLAVYHCMAAGSPPPPGILSG